MCRKCYNDHNRYWCATCGADMTDELTSDDPNAELECQACRVRREEAQEEEG
jgi:DNA-directed RNA polymerase subunit RPC12/RpoP